MARLEWRRWAACACRRRSLSLGEHNFPVTPGLLGAVERGVDTRDQDLNGLPLANTRGRINRSPHALMSVGDASQPDRSYAGNCAHWARDTVFTLRISPLLQYCPDLCNHIRGLYTRRPALPGIVSGLVVAMAISTGETAPRLFTAGFSDANPTFSLIHNPVGYLTGVTWRDGPRRMLQRDRRAPRTCTASQADISCRTGRRPPGQVRASTPRQLSCGGADAAVIYTFARWDLPTSTDAEHGFDIASFAIVKVFMHG